MITKRAAFRITRQKEIKLAALLLAVAATIAVIVELLGAAAGILAACLIPIAMVKPEWGLFVLVVAIFTDVLEVLVEHQGAPDLSVNFLAFCLGLSVLLRWAVRLERPIDVTRPLLVLIAYGAVGAASLFYARHVGAGASEIGLYVQYVALGIVAVLLMSGIGSLRAVTWALLSGAIFVGTIAVYKYWAGGLEGALADFARTTQAHIGQGTFGWRLSGPMEDPNYFAALMVFVVPLAVERLLHERQHLKRVIAAWALFVSLLCIYFTASRGALVALAIVIVNAAACYRERRLSLMLAGVSLVLVIVAASPAAYLARVESMLGVVPGLDTATPPDASIRGRLDMWRIASALFVDHPLLGVGLGNYDMHYQEYARLLGLSPQEGDLGAHSLYLEVAAERGLIGIASLAALLILTGVGLVQAAWHLQRTERADDAALVWAFGSGLLGYLAARLFLHDSYGQFLWLALTLALAIPQLVAHDDKRWSGRRGPVAQARAGRHDARAEAPAAPDPQASPAAARLFGQRPSLPAPFGEGPGTDQPAPSGGAAAIASPASPEPAFSGELPARAPSAGSAAAAPDQGGESFAARLASRLASSHPQTTEVQHRTPQVHRSASQQILMIFGCRCSGATLATQFFAVDGHAVVLDGAGDDGGGRTLRLSSSDVIERAGDASRAPLIVIKLQGESQHADALLEDLAAARALWMYRHYRDVASSHVRSFGTRQVVRDLQALVDGETEDRAAAAMPGPAMALARRHCHADMRSEEAAALLWYLRNSQFFGLQLDRHPRVRLLNYDALVADPLSEITAVYGFLDRVPPSRAALSTVSRRARRGSAAVTLSPEVEAACRELWRALRTADELGRSRTNRAAE